MNVVIYARYSSHSQTEQSIEGQLHTCYEYAKNNGYLVVGEYIDRAQSGTTDSRAEFQRMIADSDKHTFEGVLVYQLDRFARNRYDSAINKAKLKKNGVRVISARENISDDASGILVEGVLESMAEYYSAELSQKIRRGMEINAQKCLANGSNPGLGYKVVKMAEIVGVKQSSLNRYELNQASPTFETLTRYADYFDVSMDYIFGRTDNPQGKLYEYKPKIQQNDPQMQKFVEMCFDPASPMNARLKETLLQMLGEAKQ